MEEVREGSHGPAPAIFLLVLMHAAQTVGSRPGNYTLYV